jgi:uncharacterized protein (DUF952 family)
MGCVKRDKGDAMQWYPWDKTSGAVEPQRITERDRNLQYYKPDGRQPHPLFHPGEVAKGGPAPAPRAQGQRQQEINAFAEMDPLAAPPRRQDLGVKAEYNPERMSPIKQPEPGMPAGPEYFEQESKVPNGYVEPDAAAPTMHDGRKWDDYTIEHQSVPGLQVRPAKATTWDEYDQEIKTRDAEPAPVYHTTVDPSRLAQPAEASKPTKQTNSIEVQTEPPPVDSAVQTDMNSKLPVAPPPGKLGSAAFIPPPPNASEPYYEYTMRRLEKEHAEARAKQQNLQTESKMYPLPDPTLEIPRPRRARDLDDMNKQAIDHLAAYGGGASFTDLDRHLTEMLDEVYVVCSTDAWATAQKKGWYQVDMQKGGYIQCTSLQQPIQLTNVSAQALDKLVLVEVATSKLASQLRYDGGDYGKIPRIYGPLNCSAVTRVFPLKDANLAGTSYFRPAQIISGSEQFARASSVEPVQAPSGGNDSKCENAKKGFFNGMFTKDKVQEDLVRMRRIKKELEGELGSSRHNELRSLKGSQEPPKAVVQVLQLVFLILGDGDMVLQGTAAKVWLNIQKLMILNTYDPSSLHSRLSRMDASQSVEMQDDIKWAKAEELSRRIEIDTLPPSYYVPVVLYDWIKVVLDIRQASRTIKFAQK